MVILYLGICWFLGIWVAEGSGWHWSVWVAAAVGGAAAAIAVRRQRHAAIVLACLAALGAGGARYTLSLPRVVEADIASYANGDKVTITGIVQDAPVPSGSSQKVRLQVESLTDAAGNSQPVEGPLFLRLHRFPKIEYGMELTLKGQLQTPEAATREGEAASLRKQGYRAMMAWPQLQILAEGKGNLLHYALLRFKRHAGNTIEHLLSDPEAALLQGILLGDDSGMPSDLTEDFRATGVTHIIAISGFNIAILAGVLLRSSEPFLGKKRAALLAMVGISLYTTLVGADPAVVRATIMATAALIGTRLLGRPVFAFAPLILAGLLMTAVDPVLLWDIGFQLSFSATLSLLLYSEGLSRRLHALLSRYLQNETLERLSRLLSETVIVTLAAQLLTVPLLLFHFQQLSLASLPANLLILPVQPAIMIWGGLATLSGMVLPAIGQLFAWVAWLFLAYTILMVRLLASLPLASIPLQAGSLSLPILYALLATFTWLRRHGRQEAQKRLTQLHRLLRERVAKPGAFALGLVLALLTWQWAHTQPDNYLHVAFLNIGRGDAIFIQTPAGYQILVDGGLQPEILQAELGRQMPFWDRHLDLMIASHPDGDHVNGLPGLFERYQVGQLLTNGQEAGANAAYEALLAAADAAGTGIHAVHAGEMIDLQDGVELQFLYPAAFQYEGDNDNSVALRLVYGQFTLLLTGDLEEAGERGLLAEGRPVEALVFKAGHHGARASNNDFFLEAVQPHWFVVSTDPDNHFGHPHPEALARAAAVGATVLRTDALGTIEVTSDGQRLWWTAGQ